MLKNEKAIIGSRIMQRRKAMQIEQSKLAEMINVSENRMSDIEDGKSFPELHNFIKMCKILNCNADYFFSGIIKNTVEQSIIDMIAAMSIEDQKTIWKLVDAYIHRYDNDVF